MIIRAKFAEALCDFKEHDVDLDTILQGPKVLWSFLFGGDADWMDANKGNTLVEALQGSGKRATIYRVQSAGHQLFLDDPEGSAKGIINSLKYLLHGATHVRSYSV